MIGQRYLRFTVKCSKQNNKATLLFDNTEQ